MWHHIVSKYISMYINTLECTRIVWIVLQAIEILDVAEMLAYP